MINAVEAGALTLEKLEAMTCVCSVGLDMIAIPGKTSEATISGIIADEMAIGMVNQKTTAVRVIPVIGKDVGDMVEFGGLLGYAPVMPVNSFSCEAFVSRKDVSRHRSTASRTKPESTRWSYGKGYDKRKSGEDTVFLCSADGTRKSFSAAL